MNNLIILLCALALGACPDGVICGHITDNNTHLPEVGISVEIYQVKCSGKVLVKETMTSDTGYYGVKVEKGKYEVIPKHETKTFIHNPEGLIEVK